MLLSLKQKHWKHIITPFNHASAAIIFSGEKSVKKTLHHASFFVVDGSECGLRV